MNTILEIVINNRGGNYCHALEVNDVYELENTVESIYNEFIDSQDKATIIDFFNTMQIYSLNEVNDDSIYNFDIEGYINSL